MSGRLMREKTEAIVSTGAAVVASANPGCTMQLLAGLGERGVAVDVVHPIELIDAATR
jgi:glycolate oxidase iron-sulfur subunit